LTTRVSQVVPHKPASLAGVIAGDSIVAMNGTPVQSWEWLLDHVGQSAGRPVQLQIVRQGTPIALTMTPLPATLIDQTGEKIILGKVGMMASIDSTSVSMGQALRDGTKETGNMAILVFTMLRKIATRQTSVKELGGPIAIAQSSVQAAKEGAEVL